MNKVVVEFSDFRSKGRFIQSLPTLSSLLSRSPFKENLTPGHFTRSIHEDLCYHYVRILSVRTRFSLFIHSSFSIVQG